MELRLKKVNFEKDGEKRVFNKLYVVINDEVIELTCRGKSDKQSSFYKSLIVSELEKEDK